MTARETAKEHLHTLQQSIADWSRYKDSYNRTDLEKDRDVQNMVLHALLVSIQSCIDITNHLISDLGLPKPNSYREAFEVLSRHGYLSEEVGNELAGLASFRNVLVHVYWRLDLDRVYQILETKDAFINGFIREIVDLLA